MSNILHNFDEYEEPNDAFIQFLKDFLIHISSEVYMILGFLVTFCIFCYMRHFKRKLEMKRRPQELQRAALERYIRSYEQRMLSVAENVNNETPGTAGFSEGVKILIGDNIDKLPYVFMRSGSRIIFGRFEDDDFSDLDQSI